MAKLTNDFDFKINNGKKVLAQIYISEDFMKNKQSVDLILNQLKEHLISIGKPMTKDQKDD